MTMQRVRPVRPETDITALLDQMAGTGFQGRKLGEACAAWRSMIDDPACTILLGLSGAMIPAGMQECLIALVENRYVDGIVSTGANIFHDICEHLGTHHYQGYHHVDDAELYEQGIDRIYDVFAREDEFRDVDGRIASFAASLPSFSGSSRAFMEVFGDWLMCEAPAGRSLLATCVREEVPVFVPALADSSIGIGLVMARRDGADVQVDQIADADEITRLVERSEATGVVYLGGGVPKNFIQQTQVVASIHGQECGGHRYAVQFTTDAPHWGGLSGCTFDEAISWGKESPAGKNVQCFCDVTIALPLVVSALLGGMASRKNPPEMRL